ncbi:MAG TPA: hypothetical protein VLB86_02710 [Gaiellaceae bacterium]|nr:hypothetical protein [Gaiellaceae bacterium]
MTDVAAALPEERTTGTPRRWRSRRRRDAVSFAELTWAHHLRQRALETEGDYDGPAEERYRAFLRRFEAQHGEVLAAYWCSREASGAVVTVRRPSRLARLFGADDEVRLHRATDWTTKDMPEAAQALHTLETLAVKVSEVLRDTSQRVAMLWLFTEVSYLLGFADGEQRRGAEETARVVKHEREEIERVERYYRYAAVRAAHVTYLGGALLGVVPLVLLGAMFRVLYSAEIASNDVRTAFACFAAGGLGALVSVMSRLTSRQLTVDYDIGKDTLRALGALRPFVGGVFGLASFFALQSDIVNLQVGRAQTGFAFYVFFAFIAGFSERWARDMLLSGGGRLSPRNGGQEEPEERPPGPGPSHPEPSA